MAEGTRLLSEYGVTSLIEGSNPSLSVLQIGYVIVGAALVAAAAEGKDQVRASIMGLELDDCQLAASEVGDMYLKSDKSGSRISADALAI